MELIIDVGNTAVKMAVYEQKKMINIIRIPHDELKKTTQQILENYYIKHSIIASVGRLDSLTFKWLQEATDLVVVGADTKVSFENLYATPKTLGIDRIALASAAVSQFVNQNVLVIDAGTCITYDFVNAKAQYLGGAIAPGVKSRYRALHDYTEKLPLLTQQPIDYFTGNSTETSIHSGVVNGMVCEINGIIDQYTAVYKKLTVVLTGGDAEFLAKQLKNSIFVAPFFLLDGLYEILKLNINE